MAAHDFNRQRTGAGNASNSFYQKAFQAQHGNGDRDWPFGILFVAGLRMI
jgi:hypothetical protein